MAERLALDQNMVVQIHPGELEVNMTTIDVFEKVANGEMTAQEGADLLMKRDNARSWLCFEKLGNSQWWFKFGNSFILLEFRWPKFPVIVFDHKVSVSREEFKEMFKKELKRIRKFAKLSENQDGVTRH